MLIFDQQVLLRYWPELIDGLMLTVVIVVVSLAVGAAIGLAMAIMNLSGRRGLERFARIYINAFRNTPEMVIIFWVYFCLPQIVDLRLSPLATGTLALAMSAGAFLAEIFRAGIQAVPRGQVEAARSLGLSALPLWRFVILPQALRRMVPPLVNYFTEMLKHSTLLSAIGVAEIAHTAFRLGGQTFRYLEFFTAIGIIFFAIIFPLSLIARRLAGRGAIRLGT